MALECVSVSQEATCGQGAGGEFYLGDSFEILDYLTEKYSKLYNL